MITLKDIAEKLKSKTDIAIFCHIRPDGDTLGSAMALALALKKMGKVADVFCAQPVPQKFKLTHPAFNNVESELKREYDCHIAVDVSDIALLGDLQRVFLKNKCTLLVDHHISNTRFAEFSYVFDLSANCQNIFALIKVLGVKIDKDMATCLLTGVVTDTGAFAHKNADENVLKDCAELVSLGGDLNGIIYQNFKNQPKERAMLHSITMQKIRYALNDRLGIIVVTKENISKCGATSDMTEGFIDFVMSIDCVEVGLCLLQTGEETFKVSFRSKGANVNQMAGVYGGGGHVLASGCMINGPLEEVIEKLTYTVSQYID